MRTLTQGRGDHTQVGRRVGALVTGSGVRHGLGQRSPARDQHSYSQRSVPSAAVASARMVPGVDARIGYGAGTGITSVAEVREHAAWAAASGFESFWLSQVFGVDPIVALAAVGAEFPGLTELGTSVIPLAGRHPLALAAQARTAQSALDGRFTLGIGTSHQMVVEGFFGESYERPFSRASEFLAALTPLLNGQPADVEGDHVFAKGWLTIDAEPCPGAARRTRAEDAGARGPTHRRDLGRIMGAEDHRKPHCAEH